VEWLCDRQQPRSYVVCYRSRLRAKRVGHLLTTTSEEGLVTRVRISMQLRRERVGGRRCSKQSSTDAG